MIIALEGPDRCGKTTLFLALQGRLKAKFVPGLPLHRSLMPVMSHVERRQDALWRMLYEPSRLYVTDRHLSVSSLVYSELYNRDPVDVRFWYDKVQVLYLDVPTKELERRHKLTGDALFDFANYERVKRCYMKALQNFDHAMLDGTMHMELLIDHVLIYVRSLRDSKL